VFASRKYFGHNYDDSPDAYLATRSEINVQLTNFPTASSQLEYKCAAVGEDEWEGNHDFVKHDGSRYGCSPTNNNNLLGYVKDPISGDFFYSIKVDTTTCDAGFVIGFYETNDKSTFVTDYPENKASGKRFGYSTICTGATSSPGFAYADSGSGTSRDSYSESNSEINMAIGDIIGIGRTGNKVYIKVNGVKIHEFTLESNNDGYIWTGHYNSASAQCFSSPTLCMNRVPETMYAQRKWSTNPNPNSIRFRWSENEMWYGPCNSKETLTNGYWFIKTFHWPKTRITTTFSYEASFFYSV
jgi:hypothetical protein